jgi:serine/threonine-protein kinase
MLGEVRLGDEDGGDFDALMRQPKHVALLAYLALPQPGSWHRRDALLGVFWPDHEQGKARSSLRSALYTLRRHLPDATIRSRGDEEVGLNPEELQSDVGALAAALEAGRYAEALEAYRGELLPGFYVADAPEFDRWLQGERDRARGLAGQAAAHLAREHTEAGRLGPAAAAARRGAELAPTDETAARRWISLLDRTGDRAGAFAAYERLREQLNESLGVRPSSETVALMDAIRTRSESRSVDDASLLPIEAKRVAEVPVNRSLVQPPTIAAIAPAAEDGAPSAVSLGLEGVSEPSAPRRRGRSWWLALPIIGALASWALLRDASPVERGPTLVIYPMRNETGNPALAYLAQGIAEGIGRRIEGVGGIAIRSSARADLSDTAGPDLGKLGSDLRRTFVLESWLRSRGDTLDLRTTVLNAETRQTEDVTTVSFTLGGISNAESRLAAAVGGTMLRRRLLPKEESDRIEPESYRLTLLGLFHLNGNAAWDLAGPAFEAAVARDPSNARAWAGISSVWLSRVNSDQVPQEEGLRAGIDAAQKALALDPRQGSALANLGMAIAIRDLSLAPALALVDSAIAVEPSNTEAWLLKTVLMRHAHRYDAGRDAIRFAQHLDPYSDLYRGREVNLYFCASRPADALALLEAQLELRSGERAALAELRRALAMLGRFDEALEAWKRLAAVESDTALLQRLGRARGREGYFDLLHAEGRAQLERVRRPGRVSLLRESQALLLAGDSTNGFRALERLEQEGSIALFRLACLPPVDEFRDTPRFKALLLRVGPLR